MAVNIAYITGVTITGTGFRVTASWWDNDTFVENRSVDLNMTGVTNLTQLKAAALAAAVGYATGQGYTVPSGDYMWITDPTGSQAISPLSFNYNPSRSIVTGTGATGFQVSSTRASFVSYTPKITTTATIAGGAEGYVVLEIAPTNSATAGDWKEVARLTNGQALSLALTLQSVQPVGSGLSAMVPAGYYAKLRSVNTTGTPAYTSVSGQEVLLASN